eukprot:651483-Pelagomonas_calceolata.AAC.5
MAQVSSQMLKRHAGPGAGNAGSAQVVMAGGTGGGGAGACSSSSRRDGAYEAPLTYKILYALQAANYEAAKYEHRSPTESYTHSSQPNIRQPNEAPLNYKILFAIEGAKFEAANYEATLTYNIRYALQAAKYEAAKSEALTYKILFALETAKYRMITISANFWRCENFVDFARDTSSEGGIVERIEADPNRSGFLALVRYESPGASSQRFAVPKLGHRCKRIAGNGDLQLVYMREMLLLEQGCDLMCRQVDLPPFSSIIVLKCGHHTPPKFASCTLILS